MFDDMTGKEKAAWLVWASGSVAAVIVGYINAGFTGALSAYAASSYIASAVLGNQARNQQTK